MYPQGRHPAPHQPGQPGFKFTVAESCDRIKDEFQFLQAQYHSLKVEYDKLANEKTEMQRHYVMYYEMSYGLNIEMHKQVQSRSVYSQHTHTTHTHTHTHACSPALSASS
ncbi:transducin-like enhancer protein 3 [Salarias fasciatus]|nr:transducin-like enhancer protein 3 [Salarias fasciatus]